MKIYFAGPLFSESERDRIRATISKIKSLAAQRGMKTEIISPYDLITQEEIDRLGEHAKVEIFSRCVTEPFGSQIYKSGGSFVASEHIDSRLCHT